MSAGPTEKRSPLDLALGVGALVLGALFLPKLIVGDESALYTRVLTPAVLLYAAAIPKLVALLAGTIAAYACTKGFDAGTPTRRGWTLITIWLGAWFAGQATLGYYQLVLMTPAPFPSAADALFMVGYPTMILAVHIFIRAYVATGMFGGARKHLEVAFVAAVPLFVAAVFVLVPVLASGGDGLELALNAAYPSLDLLAMVPTIVLLRISLRLRGGKLFWVWALICAGLVFMVVGDVLFGYFEMLGVGFLEPLLDLCYIASYVLIARGVYQQYRVMNHGA